MSDFEFTIECEVRGAAEVVFAEKSATLTMRLRHWGTTKMDLLWTSEVCADAIEAEVLGRLGVGQRVVLRLTSSDFAKLAAGESASRGVDEESTPRLLIDYKGGKWGSYGTAKPEKK